MRPTSDIMDAGITTAATATGASPGAQPAGLFGAINGAQGHGQMAGFQALLAAFFGHQGDAAQLGAGSTALQGKTAFATKSDSKAGQMTMDDALNPTLDPNAPHGDKTDALATADDAKAATGLSVDAQALAALFAAPAAKAPVVEETTDKAPAPAGAGKAAALTVETPIFGAGVKGDKATADATKADTPTDKASETAGRAKLIDIAQALAATRQAARADAAKTADTSQPVAKPAAPAPTVDAQAALAAATDAADTVQANPAAEAQAAQVEAPPPVFDKDRGGLRATRLDGARKDGASSAAQAPVATDLASAVKPATAAATALTAQPDPTETADGKSDKPADMAPLKVEVADDTAQAQAPAVAAHAAPASAQAATTAVRGAPETVASLAAQIIKKAEGRTTRFDVELHPADLGRVDVRLEIGAHGRLTASMSFENPQAAAELRGRADELQRALENAGFDLSGGLSFDVAGDRSQNQNQAQQQASDNGGGAMRGRAFEAALATAGETANAALAGALSAYQSRVAPGLDIRI